MNPKYHLSQAVICDVDLIRWGQVVVPVGTRGVVYAIQHPDPDGLNWYTVRWDSDPGDKWDMREYELRAALRPQQLDLFGGGL